MPVSLDALDFPAVGPYELGERTYEITYDDEKHAYWLSGIPVPSVSAVLDVLPKPALTWWGMRVGLAAVVELFNRNKLNFPTLMSHTYAEVLSGIPVEGGDSPRERNKAGIEKTLLEWLVIANRLSTNHVRDDAAVRGTSTHDALGAMVMGDFPTLSDFPHNERPYLQALNKWWLNNDGTEFLRVEQIVGSREHMFAGRFDMLCRDPDEKIVLRDLKTAKDIYPHSNYRQLAAYTLAFHEMQAYLPPEKRLHIDRAEIVNLRADGTYQTGVSYGIAEDFLACRALYQNFHDFETRGGKKLRRAR